jgi:membrane-bound lytic murein transglycosylase MltF
MPGTALDMQVHNIMDPELNLRGGVKYLRIQYEHFPEVPDHMERLRWSWASYNGGRGYVNRAFHVARLDGVADWWKWAIGQHWLMNCDCVVGGKRPDYRQMWDYVARIEAAKKEIQ